MYKKMSVVIAIVALLGAMQSTECKRGQSRSESGPITYGKGSTGVQTVRIQTIAEPKRGFFERGVSKVEREGKKTVKSVARAGKAAKTKAQERIGSWKEKRQVKKERGRGKK